MAALAAWNVENLMSWTDRRRGSNEIGRMEIFPAAFSCFCSLYCIGPAWSKPLLKCMLSICCPSCACEAFLLGLLWAEDSWISLNVSLPPSDQGSKPILSGVNYSLWPQRRTNDPLWLYLVYLRCKSMSSKHEPDRFNDWRITCFFWKCCFVHTVIVRCASQTNQTCTEGGK